MEFYLNTRIFNADMCRGIIDILVPLPTWYLNNNTDVQAKYLSGIEQTR